MRPQITFPEDLGRALNYHEKKVEKGTAELLHAHNFFKLPDEMNFYDKKERFEDLMALNERAELKLIHISLNFHPSEKDRLTKDFLIHLADEYMQKIGFGNQPYLVYKHEDAGHPHIHVLSTLIKDDGERISTHFIAKKVSEPVRKEMEQKYGFIPANKKEQQQEQDNQLSITPQKIQAGKSATMRAITNVLDHVIDRYKYTSIHELNAILRLYNVKADRGAEDGRIYKNRGLRYVVVDEQGKALTKPIKASAFYSKPTLDYLESKFERNQADRQEHKKHLKTKIDWAMQSKPETLGELAKSLQKDSIALVIRRNEQGRVYGMTYIDHNKKTVFNGSDLGKEYSSKKMLERLGIVQQQQPDKELDKTAEKNNPLQSEPQQQSSMQQKDTGHNRELQIEKDEQPSKSDKQPPKPHPSEKETVLEETSKGASKIIEQVIDPDSGSSWAINKDLLTEEQRKRKKGFQKQWEM